MLARTQTALMAATRPLRAVSAYGLFLKQTKKDFPVASFKGKTQGARIAARGKAVAQAFKSLPKPELKKLQVKAKTVSKAVQKSFFKRTLKLKNMTPEQRRASFSRKPSAFAIYLKKNYKKVSNVSPEKRMAKLAQMYKAAKKQ